LLAEIGPEGVKNRQNEQIFKKSLKLKKKSLQKSLKGL